MSRQNKFSAGFKSKVALEAIKEQSTLSELSAKYGVSQMSISRWKQELIEKSADIFSGKYPDEGQRRKEVDDLHRKIGELEMKVDFCKRVSEKLGIPVPEGY